MDALIELIDLNQKKLEFLEVCLSTNEQAMFLVDNSNISALQELSRKKKSILTSINVLDDRIIALISELKKQRRVNNLSELNPDEGLRELRGISVDVVQKMALLKQSDDDIMRRIDGMFVDYEISDKALDKKKVEYFTKNYFYD